MAPTFLILLAGGLLIGEIAHASRRRSGIDAWYARGGAASAAACAAALVLYLVTDRPAYDAPAAFRRVQFGLVLLTCAAVAAQVFAERAARAALARRLAVAGFALAVLAGANLLHDEMFPRGTAIATPPKSLAVALQTLACAGAAAVVGLSLAAIVSCVAPASGESAAAGRYDAALSAAVVLRAVLSIGVALTVSLIHHNRSYLAAGTLTLLITRWLLGLGLPGLLLFIAARRRSITGHPGHFRAMAIVTAVCLTGGEVLALYLVRNTGLPF